MARMEVSSSKHRKEGFSERMKELRAKAEEIKGGIDTLLNCKEAGNPKQIAFWTLKLSRDFVSLSQACLGEELLKKVRERGQEGNIIRP